MENARHRRITKCGDFIEVVEYLDARFPLAGPKAERRYGLSDEKREDNVRAARARARLIALSNFIEGRTYFFTSTFRDDVKTLDDALDAFTVFRRSLLKRYPLARYVVVPEVQPGSKKWHFHGLFFNLPTEAELRIEHGKRKDWKGRECYAWKFFFTKMWSKACGHSGESGDTDRAEIQALKSAGGTVWYVTKYITKYTAAVIDVGRRFYYAGGVGLRRATVERQRVDRVRFLEAYPGFMAVPVNGRPRFEIVETPLPPVEEIKNKVAEYGVTKLKGPFGRVSYTRYKIV